MKKFEESSLGCSLQFCGSVSFVPLGSGSFYHQTKIGSMLNYDSCRFGILNDFLFLKNDNVPFKSNEQINYEKKIILFPLWRLRRKIAGSGSINKRYGSPVPYQNITDLQHFDINFAGLQNSAVFVGPELNVLNRWILFGSICFP